MNDHVTISIRLPKAVYAALQAKGKALEPPALPTVILRWLIDRYMAG